MLQIQIVGEEKYLCIDGRTDRPTGRYAIKWKTLLSINLIRSPQSIFLLKISNMKYVESRAIKFNGIECVHVLTQLNTHYNCGTMNIIKIFQIYFKFFHLMGQSLVIKNRHGTERRTTIGKLIEYIPGFVWLVIHLTGIFLEILYHYVWGLESSEKALASMYLFRMTALGVNHLILFLQIISHPEEIFRCLNSFDRCEWYLQKRLNVIVSLDTFKMRYLRHVIIIVCSHLLPFIVRSVVRWFRYQSFQLGTHTYLSIVLTFFSPAVKVYALFFIDLFNWLVRMAIKFIEMHLNDIPLEQNVAIVDEEKYINILRHCKYIHFKLWKSMKIIERQFGWLLISICLSTFVEVLFSSFWIFLLAHHSHKSGLLREYFICRSRVNGSPLFFWFN